MTKYYFTNKPDNNGYNEVHTEDCIFMPLPPHSTYIGLFNNCTEAIKAAEEQYPTLTFDGCCFCCRPCHKG